MGRTNMNEIFKRRSIREYTDTKISNEDIDMIIKASMNAPSANNERPTFYLVIDDIEKLKFLSDINQYGKMLTKASHAIIVCAKEVSSFWVQDAAAATENILLEATSLGIGSCWIGLYPKDVEREIKDYFKIPEDIRAFSIISLGYPLNSKKKNNFYEKERIHYNEWR
jgi:nitroreductase